MNAPMHDFSDRSAALKRLPLPASIETEQAVLGTLLMSNETLGVISSHASINDFLEPVHQAIFDVMSTLVGEGKAATPSTLAPFLGDHDLGNGVTVGAYLARLCAQATAPAAVAGYAQLLRSLSARRQLATAAEALDQRARATDVHDDPAEIAAAAMIELQQVAASAASDTTRGVGHFADELMSTVAGIRDGSITNRMITTGYSDLDRAMNGYVPGTLVIVAGRPGMGKSIFANSSGYRCAKIGVGVLQFPLEIGPGQFVARTLADMAFVGAGRSPAFRDIGVRANELEEHEVSAIRDAHARLRELPIEIDSRSRVTLPQIAAKVAQSRRAMRARGLELGVIFIDHADFIASSDRYKGNRTQEIGEIAIGLKDLARSQDVCIVLLSQLSREVERRGPKDRRPTLADLRNSGDLEQVADVVAFVYREEYYLSRSAEYLAGDADAINAALDARGKFEIILGKTRAGPTPTIRLWCDPASSSISSYERGTA